MGENKLRLCEGDWSDCVREPKGVVSVRLNGISLCKGGESSDVTGLLTWRTNDLGPWDSG